MSKHLGGLLGCKDKAFSRHLIGFPDGSCIRVRYIDYTESGENNGTMIFDGVCYSVIHFGRVILYVWSSPF